MMCEYSRWGVQHAGAWTKLYIDATLVLCTNARCRCVTSQQRGPRLHTDTGGASQSLWSRPLGRSCHRVHHCLHANSYIASEACIGAATAAAPGVCRGHLLIVDSERAAQVAVDVVCEPARHDLDCCAREPTHLCVCARLNGIALCIGRHAWASAERHGPTSPCHVTPKFPTALPPHPNMTSIMTSMPICIRTRACTRPCTTPSMRGVCACRQHSKCIQHIPAAWPCSLLPLLVGRCGPSMAGWPRNMTHAIA
jgi:hypothetical protein